MTQGVQRVVDELGDAVGAFAFVTRQLQGQLQLDHCIIDTDGMLRDDLVVENAQIATGFPRMLIEIAQQPGPMDRQLV